MSSATASSTDVRLPSWQRAVRYDVALVPDLSAFTFQGHVRTHLNLTQSTRVITLNTADCTFPNGSNGKPLVSVSKVGEGDGKSVVPCDSVEVDSKSERAQFSFGSELASGDYVLSVRYDGVLNDQLAGFYRSSYKTESGETKWMAVTQHEATDCRRTVPCIDEPAAKAIFDVTLIVASGLEAISNMPVKERVTVQSSSDEGEEKSRGLTYNKGMIRHVYYPSPIMSSYLLAFVVGEFDFLSTMSGGTEIRVYTRKGISELGRFSLNTAAKALAFFSEYFGIPYPLMKLDLLAIPDFAAGAMENYGCITYRETALLIDAKNSSAAVMQRVSRTVCHEIAHMWFGNLVTMEWWSYLWLNEGFARFLEHLAVDAIYPEWHIWEGFVADVFGQAQSLDSLQSSHPVEVIVNHPSEVNEIFDSISYAKGGSIIRMLYSAIGEEAFRTGLSTYLKRFSYQNTKTKDLWDAFSESSGVDVAAMMNTWVTSTGYPVVQVSAVAGEGQRLSFKQERFLANYDPSDESLKSTVWTIPIQVGSWKKDEMDAEPDTMRVLLNKHEATAPVLGFSDEYVTKVNVAQSGFYRVQYTPELLARIAPFIPRLPQLERLGLLRDVFAIASSGRASMRTALDILTHYENEQNLAVVSALAGNLSLLASLHADTPYHAKLQALIRSVFKSNFDRLAWSARDGIEEDATMRSFRALVINMVGNVGADPAVREEAILRFRRFVADPSANPITADLRGPIYAMVAKQGSAEDHAAMLKMYRESDLQEEKNRLLHNLGVVSGDASRADYEKERIQSALNLLLSGEVRPGNVAFIMSGIGSSKLGREMAWAWFTANFEMVQQKFCKGQNFIISGILNGMLGGHSNHRQVAEFKTFFADHPIPQATRTINQLSESIGIKADRVQRESKDVEAWLNENCQ